MPRRKKQESVGSNVARGGAAFPGDIGPDWYGTVSGHLGDELLAVQRGNAGLQVCVESARAAGREYDIPVEARVRGGGVTASWRQARGVLEHLAALERVEGGAVCVPQSLQRAWDGLGSPLRLRSGLLEGASPLRPEHARAVASAPKFSLLGSDLAAEILPARLDAVLDAVAAARDEAGDDMSLRGVDSAGYWLDGTTRATGDAFLDLRLLTPVRSRLSAPLDAGEYLYVAEESHSTGPSWSDLFAGDILQYGAADPQAAAVVGLPVRARANVRGQSTRSPGVGRWKKRSLASGARDDLDSDGDGEDSNDDASSSEDSAALTDGRKRPRKRTPSGAARKPRVKINALPGVEALAGHHDWLVPRGYSAAAHTDNPEEELLRGTWVLLVRRDIPRSARQRRTAFRAAISAAERLAEDARVHAIERVLEAGRRRIEGGLHARMMGRELLAYWRQREREMRDVAQRAVRDEQRRREEEERRREEKRQQRKLEFLLSQTEIYSHFVARKMDVAEAPEERPTYDETLDDVESHERARQAAAFALQQQRKRVEEHDSRRQEDASSFKGGTSMLDPSTMPEEYVSQATIFQGSLKEYQLRGVSWLVNLYDQGINGILADEMGLGKTVQSIALLAYLAEVRGVWGPFLVMSPTSTLHNWCDEVRKFCPSLCVVPYWGTPEERRVLRQYWAEAGLRRRDSKLHICVTSYHYLNHDLKYFRRVKWEYMILDEAQAIKSSNTARWKKLMTFNCRNRLLLTGTPIQNNMAELWSLLHFIMPTLFDSHEEFSDWFAKDIEEHAGGGASINQRQLARLHMVLKPFMLRRVKRDVESQLPPKREVEVMCTPTKRQARMYEGIKAKISVAELLGNVGAQGESTLMNIVMQLRKVVNHPDLFERRDIRSPLWVPDVRCAARDAPVLLALPDRRDEAVLQGVVRHAAPLCGMAPVEATRIARSGVLERWLRLARAPRHTGVRLWDTSPAAQLRERHDLVRAVWNFIPPAAAPAPGGEPPWARDRVAEMMAPVQAAFGSNDLWVPNFDALIADSGKLRVLDALLARLKRDGHRVLLYSQMTRMLDLIEDFMTFRRYRHLRLDGQSKLSDRGDMVQQFQNDDSVFVFILSTRAGGVGINLTGADTVIFYDSDWNPSCDEQSCARAHRLGQTRPVTIYRLVMKNTIDERILQRAAMKGKMQSLVVGDSTVEVAQDGAELSTNEVASLLIDDESQLRALQQSRSDTKIPKRRKRVAF